MQQQAPLKSYMRYEDVIAGFALIALATFGLWASRTYAVGTLKSMGPGWFPRATCLVIMALGSALALTNLLKPHNMPPEKITLKMRPMLLFTAAYVSFGLILSVVGLLPAILIVIVISGLAIPRRSLLEWVLIILALEAMAFCMWYLVKLPIPLIGGH
jgi:hypothetical protein